MSGSPGMAVLPRGSCLKGRAILERCMLELPLPGFRTANKGHVEDLGDLGDLGDLEDLGDSEDCKDSGSSRPRAKGGAWSTALLLSGYLFALAPFHNISVCFLPSFYFFVLEKNKKRMRQKPCNLCSLSQYLCVCVLSFCIFEK